jgi:hypothetical protein
MASKDRMIVPFVCTECGAPLKRKKQACEFCRVEWEMVKRYNGPDMPVFEVGTNGPIGFISESTMNCSYPSLISMNYGTLDCDY